MRGRGQDETSRRALVMGGVGLSLVLAAGYVLSDDTGVRVLLNQLSIAATILLLVLTFVLAGRRERTVVVWALIGMLFVAIGEVTAVVLTTDGRASYPNPGELPVALGALCFTVGVVRLVGRRPRLHRPELLDMAIGGLGVVLFAIQTGLLPDAGVALRPPVLVGWAFVALTTVILACGVLAVSRPETTHAATWGVLAALLLLAGDAGLQVGTAAGYDVDGRFSDVYYLLSRGALVAFAASCGAVARGGTEAVERRRVLVIGAFALLGPLGAVVAVRTGADVSEPVALAAAVLPVVLLTWRASLAVARLGVAAGSDDLTGLLNRRAFLQLAQDHVDSRRDFAVLLCDLDGFKAVNDRLGHFAGDGVLVAFAGALRRAVPAGGSVARLGGDEFAVLVPGARHPDDLRVELEERLTPMLADLHGVGVSIGAAAAGPSRVGPGTDDMPLEASEVLHRADEAMYGQKRARARGRGPAPAVVGLPDAPVREARR